MGLMGIPSEQSVACGRKPHADQVLAYSDIACDECLFAPRTYPPTHPPTHRQNRGLQFQSSILVPDGSGFQCTVVLRIGLRRCLVRRSKARRPPIVHGDVKPGNVFVECREAQCFRGAWLIYCVCEVVGVAVGGRVTLGL